MVIYNQTSFHFSEEGVSFIEDFYFCLFGCLQFDQFFQVVLCFFKIGYTVLLAIPLNVLRDVADKPSFSVESPHSIPMLFLFYFVVWGYLVCFLIRFHQTFLPLVVPLHTVHN